MTDPTAELAQRLYAELKALAQSLLRRERPDHTLQPTALVHEAYLRLAGADVPFQDREHFLAVAATTLRRALVDHARASHAAKRGAQLDRVELHSGVISMNSPSWDVLALNEALEELEILSPRQSRIVELRFFAGLTLEEMEPLLGVSERTLRREWRVARAWLLDRMEPES